MRFSVVAFAATFALAAAQDLSNVPSCAIPCFATAIQGSGCGLSDIKCQCTTGADKIAQSLLTCAPQKCSQSDLAKLEPAVKGLCSAAGVDVSIPAAAATSAAASASGAVASATASSNATMSRPASSSATVAQSTGAAAANGVTFGAVALGIAALAL